MHRVSPLVPLCSLLLACHPPPGASGPYAEPTDESVQYVRDVALLDAVFCGIDDHDCHVRANQERVSAEQRLQAHKEGEATRAMMAAQHHERTAAERGNRLDGNWYCFEGDGDGGPAGACRTSLDACIDTAIRASEAGLGGDVACSRQQDVTCYGAVRSVDAERVARCFPSADSCERHQSHLQRKPGWTDVSDCMAVR